MDLATLLGNCQNPGEKRLRLLALSLFRSLCLRYCRPAAVRRGAGLSFESEQPHFVPPKNIPVAASFQFSHGFREDGTSRRDDTVVCDANQTRNA